MGAGAGGEGATVEAGGGAGGRLSCARHGFSLSGRSRVLAHATSPRPSATPLQSLERGKCRRLRWRPKWKRVREECLDLIQLVEEGDVGEVVVEVGEVVLEEHDADGDHQDAGDDFDYGHEAADATEERGYWHDGEAGDDEGDAEAERVDEQQIAALRDG